jgi:hypothetical protein
MLVFRGSMNFTSHPEVLIAPRAPIDPECDGTLRGRPTGKDPGERPGEVLREVTTLRLENQQKEATVVDPLLFHALTFNRQADYLEHSVLLTVTSVGVPCGASHSERASTHQ